MKKYWPKKPSLDLLQKYKNLCRVEPEKVGPQLQGLPAPESEAIAGETVAITSEGEALLENSYSNAANNKHKREEQDAAYYAEEAIMGDMPEAEVRTARERDAIAQREQPDLFPTELAIAEDAKQAAQE